MTSKDGRETQQPASHQAEPDVRQEIGRALGQLRHAYRNLLHDRGDWDLKQRTEFADGLISPQIRRLEKIVASMDRA